MIAPSLPPSRSLFPETVDRYAYQAHELLSFLKIGRASVAGNSMGGWIAMKLALMDPKTVDHLILEDTAGISPSDGSAELLSKLNRSRIPTLIIWGADDTVIPPSNAETIRSSVESSRLVMIGGAGHVPHWEQPRAFDDAIIRFLEA